MTIENYMRGYLDDRAMFPADIEKIVQAVKSNPANEPMKDRWNHEVSDYPVVLLKVLMIAVDAEAIAFIDKNCPMHFARPLFTGEVPA